MKKILEKTNSPVCVMLVVASLYLAFLLAGLKIHQWDPSRFVVAGDRYVQHPELAPKNLYIYKNSDGYCGEIYYRMALSPFSREKTVYGLSLDGDDHHFQRFLLPFLAWVLSGGGRPGLIPIAFLLINYVSICIMGLVAGMYAKNIGRHALWGLVIPLYAGFLLTISRNLTEILEITLLVSVFVSMGRGRNILAAVLLSLAVLTRESALIVVAAIFLFCIVSYIKSKKIKDNWYWFILPAAVYLVWRGWLFFNVNQDFKAIPDVWLIIGIPFKGFIQFFIKTIPFNSSGNIVWFTELCMIIVFTLSVFGAIRDSNAFSYEKYSWILYLILIVTLTNNIWIEDWGFLRIISEFYLTGSIILLQSHKRYINYLFTGSIISWFLLAVNVLHRY